MFLPFDQLGGSPLDLFQHVLNLLMLRPPELDAALSLEGRERKNPCLLVRLFLMQAKFGFDVELWLSELSGLGSLAFDPQVLFCWAAFQPLFLKPVTEPAVAVTKEKDLALGLVELHTNVLSPLIQPLQMPLQSLPALQQINTPAQLAVIHKLIEGKLELFLQMINKEINENRPQY
ncbi:hypothetical protein DUI87_23304 [Hirundo rustica rustica]|uniref:Uncharacterized protein n=1 Tax=Hirundo rustica rustica TaxID=333673 RepID=A0A3M0JI72_HIRRU|nr:hypothetical protein DUI87_23304 [Hirundo rustica rustica]